MRFMQWGMLILCSSLMASSPFTEKRTKRGPSMATLQERCCEGFGDFLQSSAKLLQSIGALQQTSVDAVGGYAQSDKESWCYISPKTKLSHCKEKLAQLNEKIESVRAACDDLLREIKAS